MKKEGIIITQEQHPDIYKWLSKYVHDYKDEQKYYTLTSDGKINAYCDVHLIEHIREIKYPFGYVKGGFSCTECESLKSLINSPETVGGYFSCVGCYSLTSFIGLPKIINDDICLHGNKFDNNTAYKERYNLYLAMWLELLESVSYKEQEEYITNYKDKKEWGNEQPIIPVEIFKHYDLQNKVNTLINNI